MTRCALIASFLYASAGLAHAQDLPRFDMHSHCEQVAGFFGPPAILGGCIEIEQASFDALKPQWGLLPGAARFHCLSVATSGGPGSYSILHDCVQMATGAGQQDQQRQFRY